MKKREISDSDTSEIQSEKFKSIKCFLKSVSKSILMYHFIFSVSIEFMLKVRPSRGSLASRLTDLDFL